MSPCCVVSLVFSSVALLFAGASVGSVMRAIRYRDRAIAEARIADAQARDLAAEIVRVRTERRGGERRSLD